MAQFDFLDNVKNTLMQQFQPESSRVNASLPPNYGQTSPAPQINVPTTNEAAQTQPGLSNYLPQQPQTAQGSQIPTPIGGVWAPQMGLMGGLGQVTLEQLLGLGFNSYLLSLLSQSSPIGL